MAVSPASQQPLDGSNGADKPFSSQKKQSLTEKVFEEHHFHQQEQPPVPLSSGNISISHDVEDEELSELFDKVLQLTSAKIPPKSPFYNSDLFLFEDSYTGLLPLNGIKKSDFEKLEVLYQDICNGNTKFAIDQNDGQLGQDMKEMIKTLLTRRIGREIIERILQNPNFAKISIAYSNEKSCARQDTSDPTHYLIYIRPQSSSYSITTGPDGINRMISTSPFITLAHELLHVMHNHGSKPKDAPTLHIDYDNINEQQTITGLIEPLSSIEQDEEDDFTPISPPTGYSDLSENSLRSAFGLPFRHGHAGVIKPEKLEITDSTASEEATSYLVSLVKYTLKHELAEFMEHNKSQNLFQKLAKDKLEDRPLLDILLDKVIAHNKLESFQLLSTLDIDPSTMQRQYAGGVMWGLAQVAAARGAGEILAHLLSQEGSQFAHHTDVKGNTLVHICLGAGKEEEDDDDLFGVSTEDFPTRTQNSTPEETILQLLHSQGIDLSQQNSAGDTPLHLAVKNGNLATIKYIVSHVSNISVKNQEGDTPLHIAVRSRSLQEMQVLVENGASLTEKNNAGQTPLQLILLQADPKMERIQWLLTRPECVAILKNPTTGVGKSELASIINNRYRLIGIHNPSFSFEQKAKVVADLIAVSAVSQDRKTYIEIINKCPHQPLREAIIKELEARGML